MHRFSLLIVALAVAACGTGAEKKGGTSAARGVASDVSSASGPVASSAPAARFAKQVQPAVSAMCAKARSAFGYGSECIETELPELASAAGKIFRLVRKNDPTAPWRYALVRPDGEIVVGRGGGDGGHGDIVREVLRASDARTMAPELLAKLHAELDIEAAVARCLPGSNDALTDVDGNAIACAAPKIEKQGADVFLTYSIEQFPHPRLLNRDAHELWTRRIEVKEHELASSSGEGAKLGPGATPPASSPPTPTMTTPPSHLAKPVEADAALSDALCKKAVESVSGIEGQKCKAYAYPSLTLPTGSLYYLANDAGERHLYGLKKPDGTIVVGYDLETTENPLVPLVKSYDPAAVPPATFVAAYLFLHGDSSKLLCLPGAGDVIPGADCAAPTVTKKAGGGLVATFIVQEAAEPDINGMIDEPAVRSFSMAFSEGGGSSGDGIRLVDLRE
ncbi:MAG: hypothetical protein U0414_41265 [Polyangiaceae bacterium]